MNFKTLFRRKSFDERVFDDLITYGIAAKIVVTRAWYNPMRWLAGKCYQKRIDPKDLYTTNPGKNK